MKVLYYLPGLALAFTTVINAWDYPINSADLGDDPSLAYTSYQTVPYCSPSSSFLRPSSISELKQIVIKSIITRQPLKALGSRHSINDVICTDGTPISMENFNWSRINSHEDTATFGAGIKMKAAMQYLQDNGRALIHAPGYTGISLGGGIGTGAHGSSLKHPPTLSAQVVRLKVIDGLGFLRIIEDRDELKAWRINLGLLGVIVEVTIKTVPLFKTIGYRTIESDSILSDGTIVSRARITDFLQMAWFPHLGKVVVVHGNYTDASVPGDFYGTLFTDVSPGTATVVSGIYDLLQERRNILGFWAIEENTALSLTTKVIGRIPIYTTNGSDFANPAVGYGWRIMSGQCTQCGYMNGNHSLYYDDAEIACDINELPGIAETIKSISRDYPAGYPFAGVAIRFAPESDAYLSFANGRKSGVVIVELITPMRNDMFSRPKAGLAAYQAIAQALITKHGGRPHWGKNGLQYHSKDVLKRVLPKRSEFIEAMLKYDPLGTFMNKFGRRLLGVSTKMDVDPKVNHCALQDYCVCQKNSDCADWDGQVCETISNGGHDYNVCKDTKVYNNTLPRPYDPYNSSSVFSAIL